MKKRARKQKGFTGVLMAALGIGILIGGPATTAPAQAAPMRVRIELLYVTCFDTEDWTSTSYPYWEGEDELYILGALAQGGWTQAALTTPIGIRKNQTKFFRAEEAVVLNHVVPEGETVRGGLIAFDEDFGQSWSNRPRWLDLIAAAVAKGVKISGYPTAGDVISFAYKAFGELAALDKEDKLGTLEVNVPALGLPTEELSWNFRQGGRWSSWNYTVVYRITRTEVPPPPPPPTCQQLRDQIAALQAQLQQIDARLAEDLDPQVRRALLAQRGRILQEIAERERQLQSCQ